MRWEGQPVPARMLPCAEVRPLAIAEAAALGDLFPCQPLHAQFIRALVALPGLDDMWLSCNATHSRAVLLRPAGGLEGAPALGIPTQARSEHLVAHTNHKRLDRLQRCNRARRRFSDGSHSLPVRVEHVNSRIISTPDAPRTWRLATRRLQIVSLKLSHSVPPPARLPVPTRGFWDRYQTHLYRQQLRLSSRAVSSPVSIRRVT